MLKILNHPHTALPSVIPHPSDDQLFKTKKPTIPLSPLAIGNSATHRLSPSTPQPKGEHVRAGWHSLGPASRESPYFFAAYNPGTARKEQKLMQRAYASVAADQLGVRREIGQEALAQSRLVAARKSTELPMRSVLAHQKLWLDPESGVGMTYTHARDRHVAHLLDDPEQQIHLMLPGYATGDRYSMILASLVEPRLHISVAFTRGDAVEEGHAREAFRVLVEALAANGDPDPTARIALVSFDGDLRAARETLGEASTLERFGHVEGFDSPLCAMEPTAQHVFHISVSTEILRRQFADLGPRQMSARHAEFRKFVANMVTPMDREHIDVLVDEVMNEQGIKRGDIGLWIADRPNPTKREAEAISRPAMFEQIADALKSDKRRVYFLADTFINEVTNASGKKIIVDRQKYRPAQRPHIGRFWAAHAHGKAILAPRQNQWYFMNRLLEKTQAPVIGIRSGALEPLALMGHPTIYLEHKDMFTPERHASWQGHLPYHRLIVDHITGYRDKATEIERARIIERTMALLVGARSGDPSGTPRDLEATEKLALKDMQHRATAIEDDVANGVLAETELQVLLEMTRQPRTALAATQSLVDVNDVPLPG